MGNVGSKTWATFGAELSDLDKITLVDKADWSSGHRNDVTNAIVKEYILRKVVENFGQDDDLKGVWFGTQQTGSWNFNTKVREADDFDFMLIMDNVAGVPTPVNASNDMFRLEIMRRRPAEGRDSYGSDRETGEDLHAGNAGGQITNIGYIEGLNLGPKYVSDFVEFPTQKIRLFLTSLVEKFAPNNNAWLARVSDIHHESVSIQLSRHGDGRIPVTFKVQWMDSVRNDLHEVSVNIYIVYRNINKTFGEFWEPPAYFDMEGTIGGMLKSKISGTHLCMTHNPKQKRWTFFYHYADQVIYNHVKVWQPLALSGFRLLKVLRDATLPWVCLVDPTSREVSGVEQLVSSRILQNMFFHELIQEHDATDWAKDKLLYRVIGMLHKLYGLAGYSQENWFSQSNIYTPQQSSPLEGQLPVGSDVYRLITLLNLRNKQYQNGSVSINKECFNNEQDNVIAASDVLDTEEQCINSWNHHYFLQFTKPSPDKNCIQANSSSPDGGIAPDAPTKKKVRLFQECSQANIERYLAGGKAKVLVASWNTMEVDTLPRELHRMILAGQRYDVYVIGTQETKTDRKDWEVKLLALLGDDYSVFYSGNHWSLSLIVLMKNDLLPFATEPEDDHVTVSPRIKWFLRTKGAIATSFKLFGTSLLFVNAHLSAHGNMMKKRIDDYNEICQGLQLPKENVHKSKDIYANFDCVFWLGDLNFRMTGGKNKWSKMNVNIGSTLAKYDEYQFIQKEGKAFKNFKEGNIRFLPTYRYDPGTSVFRMKGDNDNPSYCDRILYMCRDPVGVDCLHYNSVMEVTESDHRPVHGVFEVPIKPGPGLEGDCKLAEKPDRAYTTPGPNAVVTAPGPSEHYDRNRGLRRINGIPPMGDAQHAVAFPPPLMYGVPPPTNLVYMQHPMPMPYPKNSRAPPRNRLMPPPPPANRTRRGYKENIPMRQVREPPVPRAGGGHNAQHHPARWQDKTADMKAVFSPGNAGDFSWKTLPQGPAANKRM